MELFGFLICGKLGPAAFAATISVESDQQGERERRCRRPEQSTDRTEEDFSVYGRGDWIALDPVACP